MSQHFHVVVIGGGVLGCACAIALGRRLGAGGVALLESRVIGSGLSARHSGIVRAANRSRMAARMAKQAADMWRQLQSHWGVKLTYQTPGALWITSEQDAASWQAIAQHLALEGVAFTELSAEEATALCEHVISTHPQEHYFYEPEAMILETGEILTALHQALRNHSVAVFEHCQVEDILRNSRGEVEALTTSQGRFSCDYIINAAGAWSAHLFARCGLVIPVALEPVLAANFLISHRAIPENLPIIADQVHRFYIRRWPGSQLHVHRPRSRDPQAIKAAFALSALALEGADQIYGVAGRTYSDDALTHYQVYLRDRIPKVGSPIALTSFCSFFDITPDLGFILGPDPRVANLFHCLGAGQALKYAPVFGEITAALVCAEDPGFDLQEFTIERFFTGTGQQLCFPTQVEVF